MGRIPRSTAGQTPTLLPRLQKVIQLGRLRYIENRSRHLSDQPTDQAGVDHQSRELFGSNDSHARVVRISFARVKYVEHPVVRSILNLRNVFLKFGGGGLGFDLHEGSLASAR